MRPSLLNSEAMCCPSSLSSRVFAPANGGHGNIRVATPIMGIAREGGERFDILSMGMSGDYEVAIECGSNLVRVGSAIFGEPKVTDEDGGDED